jgi:hypothetical protein
MDGKRFRSGVKLLLPIVIVFVVALMLVEGCSSVVLLAYDLTANRNPGLASRAHMQPDTLLGWVNRPDTRDPDMFGDGVGLNINSRSFRGTREYAAEVPAGRTRILCSGDSFTFGYGVADSSSWCARLESLNPTVETVNLGHSGWGIDQSYLFYRREADDLEHDVHIFAFIPDDVRRLRLTRFVAYPKPYFRLDDDRLVLRNVPVPAPSRLRVWHTYNQGRIARARSVELGQRLLARLAGGSSASGRDPVDARRIMIRLIEELDSETRENGASFVVAFLEENLTADDRERSLRDELEQELRDRGIPFIDLWSAFRALPADSLAGAFDPRWQHYTADANAAVSLAIHQRLRELGLVDASNCISVF